MAQDLNLGKEVYDTEYESNKNLSIAGTRTQMKIMQNIYGKSQERIKNGQIKVEEAMKSIDKMSYDEFQSYLQDNPHDYDIDILNRPEKDPEVQRYINEVYKRGYDAVVDMADASLNYSEFPMVVLKSEKVLKKKKVGNVYD